MGRERFCRNPHQVSAAIVTDEDPQEKLALVKKCLKLLQLSPE
jgi:hypothetical protein